MNQLGALSNRVEYDAENGSKTRGFSMEKKFKIAIVDPDALRAAIVAEGLREFGCDDAIRLDTLLDLETRLHDLDPDIVLINLENPNRDLLEQMIRASCPTARPVALFVDKSDAALMNAAIDAGVSAYIVDGLRKDRVKNIVDLAISRFNAFSRLREELQAARTQLADRKIIDQAKALVMKSKNIPEDQAYVLMRKLAMNKGQKIVDIARAILTAAEALR